MIFTDINFFAEEFKQYNPTYVFPMFIFIPQLIGQLLTLKFVNLIPFKCGVIGIACFRMTLACSLPFMVHYLVLAGMESFAWYLTLFLLVFHSIFSVMINMLMSGFIAQFPEGDTNFMALFMVGTACNPIIVLLIQIFVLLVMDANAVFTTGIFYFLTCACVLFGMMMIFIFIVLKHPIIIDMLQAKANDKKIKEIASKGSDNASIKSL